MFYGGREYTVLLEWYDNGGQLIKSEYVKATRTLKDPEAKIGDYTYATLSDAIAAAGDNDVVELCKNVTLTETLNINKSVTIDGKDFIISGDNNKAYTAFNITAGNFTIKNATVKEFGGNIYTRQGVAVFSVPATADAKVVFNASNVKVSEYNRSAFTIASGTFNIDGCETDAMNSYVKSGKNSLTKGITTGYGSNKVTGTISNCILNGAADHPDWSASAVEVFYNADVKLIGSEINTFTTGVWVDNYYSPKGTSSSLDIQDTTIIVPEGNDAVVVYGEYNGQGGLGSSDVNILSGVFEGNIAIYGKTANDVVMISGGTFKGEVSKEADFAEDVVMDENGNARIDNSALKALVDSYEALKLNKADYTEASWKAYEAALAQAKAVLANVNATKSDIDTAKANLEAAYKGLTKPEAQPEKEVPKTADNNLVLWVALLLVGCGSVLGGVAYRKQSDKAWRRFR